jgi:ubiquitin C-terminal hydrolase
MCRENSLAVSSMTASELLVSLPNPLVNIGTSEREAVSPLVIASPPRLHGLMNLGNTCYMNVVVQALFSLPTFVSAMMRLSNRFSEQEAADANDLELRSPSRNESVYSALLHVLQDLNGADRHVPVNPVALKRSFAKHQARFWGSVQQDAHEFFCSLIDHIQEEVSSLLKKQSVNRADCPELGSICPTTYSFSCTVRNSLTCVDCGKVSHVEEMYRDFSIALPEDERDNGTKAYDLESLLHLYFQETTMSRKCEKCEGATVKAQVQILQLPRVLVLQLKRLHMDRDIPCTKVCAPVNFSSQLDIGPWCAKDVHNPKSAANGFVSDEQPMAVNCESQAHPVCELNGMLAQPSSSVQESPDYVKGDMNIREATIEDSSQMILDVANERTKVVSTSYRLQGIVQHLGGQASGGHFIADIHDAKANRWFRCDDSIVRDEPAEIVFSKVKEAYMFFYVNESLSGDNSSQVF